MPARNPNAAPTLANDKTPGLWRNKAEKQPFQMQSCSKTHLFYSKIKKSKFSHVVINLMSWGQKKRRIDDTKIIDHLVIGAAELDKAAKQMQNFIKAEFLAGGKHPLMATHNRLIKSATEINIYGNYSCRSQRFLAKKPDKKKTAGFRLIPCDTKEDRRMRHSLFVGLLLSVISNKLRCIVDTILATSLK